MDRGSAIALILIFGLTLSFFLLPRTGVTNSIMVDDTWGLAAGLESLNVNGNIKDADNPYSIENAIGGTAPSVSASLSSSIRASDETPRAVAGYLAYLYEFDVATRTFGYSPPNNLIWTDTPVDIRVNFGVVLQGGFFNVTEDDARISDVTVIDVKRGLTFLPEDDWEEAMVVFESGADPAKNVQPEVKSYSQQGEGLINSRPTDGVVECDVHVRMQCGMVLQWSLIPILNLPYMQDAIVYDVFTLYTIGVEVLIPEGQPPPITNPFEWFLEMIADFGGRIADMWDRLAESQIIILIAAVVVIITICLACVYTRRGSG